MSVETIFNQWARSGRGEGMEQSHGYAGNKILDEIPKPENFRFLDFGCGNGWAVRKMAKHPLCREAWGIDIAEEMISRAETLKTSPKEQFVRSQLHTWKSPHLFDILFSMEALYYSVPMEPTFSKLVSLLAPGGLIVVGTDYYEENTESHSWPQDLGVPMDLRSKEAWRRMFESHGLRAIKQFHIRYPETDDMKLEREVHKTTTRYTWKQTIGSLFTTGRTP